MPRSPAKSPGAASAAGPPVPESPASTPGRRVVWNETKAGTIRHLPRTPKGTPKKRKRKDGEDDVKSILSPKSRCPKQKPPNFQPGYVTNPVEGKQYNTNWLRHRQKDRSVDTEDWGEQCFVIDDGVPKRKRTAIVNAITTRGGKVEDELSKTTTIFVSAVQPLKPRKPLSHLQHAGEDGVVQKPPQQYVMYLRAVGLGVTAMEYKSFIRRYTEDTR